MAVKNTKARYFAFILYLDSIPQDCPVRLERLGLAMAVSPLHNRDKSTVAGQLYKKPHYHVLYVARNPVTMESVRKKIKRALGDQSISHIEIVDNVEYYFQYLTHDSKDAIAKNKFRYNKKDIRYINDFDIDRYVTLDEHDKRDVLNKVLNIIHEYKLANMFDLLDAVNLHGDELGLPSIDVINDIIKGNSGILRLYFDGAYQRKNYSNSKIDKATGRIKVIDKVTGEIKED